MTTNANFWNKAARKYAQRPVSDVKSWDLTLEKSRSYLKGGQILELGAGTGSTALRMHDAADHYRATDYASEMIAIANEKLAKTDIKNLEFAVGTIEDEENGRYDAVLAYNLLHLLPDIPDFLAHAHEKIKSDGLLITKSACLSGWRNLLRFPIALMRAFGKAPMVNCHSSEQLQSWFEGAGFEILEHSNLPKGSMMHFIVARKR